MAEMRLGIDERLLFVDVSAEVLGQAVEEEASSKLVDAVIHPGFISSESDQKTGRTRLTVRPRALVASATNPNHESRKNVVTLLDRLAARHDELTGSLDAISMPTDWRSSDGRLRMYVRSKWQESGVVEAAEMATEAMRFNARELQHLPANILDEMVYVGADRERGITIETNPLGSCNIGAGGGFYDPEDSHYELYQHNLYAYEQQLLCLIGAVAFATADSRES